MANLTTFDRHQPSPRLARGREAPRRLLAADKQAPAPEHRWGRPRTGQALLDQLRRQQAARTPHA